MWTVLFGDQDAAATAAEYDGDAEGRGLDARRPAPIESKPVVPPSPASTAPMTPSPPGSGAGRRSIASPPPAAVASEPADAAVRASTPTRLVSETRRPSMEPSAEEDQSAMGMLLKRMNRLMVKVGEHEFEKKTLVDGMEKERVRLQDQIRDLERQIEDLKDQNVQLQYKIEYASDPMMLERLQDITDMRDALTEVKKQLEREIEQKDRELKECKSALDTKNEELARIKSEFEERVAELESECERAKQLTQDAERQAQEEARASFQQQLEEKDELAESLRDSRDALEAQLADKEEQLKESHAAIHDATSQRDELELQLRSLTEKNTQIQEQADRITGEQYDASTAQHSRIEELLAREHEQGETISKLTQELEDYKHDCAGLWQHNEDLKQQLEGMTAASQVKEQEAQTGALLEQSAMQDQVDQLEHQLELLQQQLHEKDQALSAAQWEQNHTESEAIRADGALSTDGDNHEWDNSAIRMLADQVAAAQQELSDAMELNLHLSNRNTWLEEQFKLFTDGEGAGSDEDGGAVFVPAGDGLFANGNVQDDHEDLLSGQDEIVELHQVLQDREQKIMELDNSHAALAHELEQLKALHSELVEVKQIDEGTMTQLTYDLNEATAYIGQLQEMNANLRSEVEALKQQVDEAASVQHDATRQDDEQLQALRSELSHLQNEHQVLSLQLETAHAAVSEKSLALDAAQQELSELRAHNEAHAQAFVQRLAALESELSSTRAALQEMQQEFAESESTNLELGIEAEEWKEKFEALVTEKEVAAHSVQQQLDEATVAVERLQAELAAANATVERLQAELAAANDALVSAHAEKQQAEDGVAAKLERARHDLAAVAAEKQRVEEEAAGKLERLRHELSATAAEKAQVEEEAGRKAEQARADLAAAVAEKRASLDEMQQRLSEALEEARRSFESEKQALEQQVRNLRDESEENMQGSMELQERLEEVEHELAQCRAQLETANAARGALERAAEELERASRDAQTVRGELEHARQRAEQLRAANEQLQQASDALSEQLTAARNECAQAAAQAERAEASAWDLQRAKEELSAALDAARGEASALERQAARAGEAQRSAQSQLEALGEQNLSLVAEAERLREHGEASAARAAAETRALAQETEQLRARCVEQQEARQALEARVTALEAALGDARRSADALEHKLARAEGFAVHLEEEAHVELGRLHEANGALQAELDHALATRHELADAHDELRMRLAELQAENNVLAARAHRLTEQLSQYTELPDEDRLAASQTAAPDLWELLASGMEQLKADLELASKYAASIDASGLGGGGSTAGSVDGPDVADDAFAVPS